MPPFHTTVDICELMTAQNGRCGLEQRGEIVAQRQAVFLVLFIQSQFWGCGPQKVTQIWVRPQVSFSQLFKKWTVHIHWFLTKGEIFEN